MTTEELTAVIAKAVAAALDANKTNAVVVSDNIMAAPKLPYVVIRTFSAGVHFGELVSRNGKEATLQNCRRLWSWSGANTLHEVAMNGIASASKVSVVADKVELTEVIEVIYTSLAAEKILRSVVWA